LRIEAGARTDLGRVRKNNEDCFEIQADLNLYVLSDGMGGEAHGEVASKLAVQTIMDHCQQSANSHATPTLGTDHQMSPFVGKFWDTGRMSVQCYQLVTIG